MPDAEGCGLVACGRTVRHAGGRSINWKSKALLQRWLARCPLGFKINYLLQRYVQHSLPIDSAKAAELAEMAAGHLEALRGHGQKGPAQATWMEIGAGTDLTVPIALYANGVERQITIDITALARRRLVNAAIAGVRALDAPLLRRWSPAMIGGSKICGSRCVKVTVSSTWRRAMPAAPACLPGRST